MKTYTKIDIENMETAYRRTFMNSVSGFKNCVLVGTRSQEGQSNLAIFNSCIHLGANPGALAILFRPLSVSRQTYDNIKSTGVFTITPVLEKFVEQAHQTSAKYPSDVSEFNACGFSEVYHEDFGAPFVGEGAVSIGLSFAEEHNIELTDTVLVCGKVEFIRMNPALLEPDGYVDAAAAGTLCTNGLDAYHRTELIKRLAFARPRKSPSSI